MRTFSDIKAVVPIRPHHGMCLAFFKGNGYSTEFTRHMQEMLELFEADVPVRLTVNTDEICSACPNNDAGHCKDIKKVERYDRAVLERCELEEGQKLNFLKFSQTVQDKILQAGERNRICGDCQWNEICSNQKSRWS